MSETGRSEFDPRFADIGLIDGGLLSDGYGIVPQKVMRDTSLPRDARALYAYLASFMNGRAAAFPGVDLQMEELQLGRKRYYAMRGILEQRDLIRVGKGQRKGQRNSFNIYYFNMFPNPRRKLAQAASKEDSALAGDSGKPTKPQVAQQFQSDTVEESRDVENQTALAGDSGKPTKPQVAQQFQSDTVQNGTPNNSNSKYIHTPNSIQPEGPAGHLETRGIIHSNQLQGKPDGRSDDGEAEEGREEPARTPRLASAPSSDGRSSDGWKRLMRSSVNRNLIHAGKPRYDALVESGYSPAEIQAAWDRVQMRSKREKRGTRFYPQLKRWLEDRSDDGAQAAIERARSEAANGAVPSGAPKSLPALASRDEAFGRAYWAYCDARQRAAQSDIDPDKDPRCEALRARMLAERDAAYGRLIARRE